MSAHRVVAISEQPGVVYATVVSGKSGKTYTVTSRRGEQDACSCAAGEHRSSYACSHVRAVRDYLLSVMPAPGLLMAPCATDAPSPVSSGAPDPLLMSKPWDNGCRDPFHRVKGLQCECRTKRSA